MKLVYARYRVNHSEDFFEMSFPDEYTFSWDEERQNVDVDVTEHYINDYFGEHIDILVVTGRNGSGKSLHMEQLIESMTADYIDEENIFILKDENKYYSNQLIVASKSVKLPIKLMTADYIKRSIDEILKVYYTPQMTMRMNIINGTNFIDKSMISKLNTAISPIDLVPSNRENYFFSDNHFFGVHDNFNSTIPKKVYELDMNNQIAAFYKMGSDISNHYFSEFPLTLQLTTDFLEYEQSHIKQSIRNKQDKINCIMNVTESRFEYLVTRYFRKFIKNLDNEDMMFKSYFARIFDAMFKDIYTNIDYRMPSGVKMYDLLNATMVNNTLLMRSNFKSLNDLFDWLNDYLVDLGKNHGLLKRILEKKYDELWHNEFYDDEEKYNKFIHDVYKPLERDEIIHSNGLIIYTYQRLIQALINLLENISNTDAVTYEKMDVPIETELLNRVPFIMIELEMKCTNELNEHIKEVCDAISNLHSAKKPIRFKWKYHLSGGEQQKLSFFELFSSIKEQMNKRRSQDHVVLFLDEPDTYLHPEWERSLIDDLVKLSKLVFKETKVLFVITTNKPIILTDLPAFSVKYLGEREHMQNTFYLDIHTLYRDNFYVDGSVGVFGQKKMNDLIEKLKSGEVNENHEKLIHHIGDDYLKKKLIHKYGLVRDQSVASLGKRLKDELDEKSIQSLIAELQRKSENDKN